MKPMITAGAYYAKTHFSELLNKVAEGENIQITRHNVPVARLTPAASRREEPLTDTITKIRKFKARHKATRDEIAEMIREGRR